MFEFESLLEAAKETAHAFSENESVRRVVLFGSVAKGWEDGPARQRHVLFKDVDLAVWLGSTNSLNALGAARSQALKRVSTRLGVGIPDYVVDVFFFVGEPSERNYIGRLCSFEACPGGHADCQAPSCGRSPYLKQHRDFVFWPSVLDRDAITIFERDSEPDENTTLSASPYTA